MPGVGESARFNWWHPLIRAFYGVELRGPLVAPCPSLNNLCAFHTHTLLCASCLLDLGVSLLQILYWSALEMGIKGHVFLSRS